MATHAISKTSRDGIGFSTVDLQRRPPRAGGRGSRPRRHAPPASRRFPADHRGGDAAGKRPRVDRPPGGVRGRRWIHRPVPADHPRFLRFRVAGHQLHSSTAVRRKAAGDRGPGRRRGRGEVEIQRVSEQLVIARHNGIAWVHFAGVVPQDPAAGVYDGADQRLPAGRPAAPGRRRPLRSGDPHLALSRWNHRAGWAGVAVPGTKPGPRRFLQRDSAFSPAADRQAAAERISGEHGHRRPWPRHHDQCDRLRQHPQRRDCSVAGEPLADGRLRLRGLLQPAKPEILAGDGLLCGAYATIFISGTASITDSETRHAGDVVGRPTRPRTTSPR